MPKPPYLGQGLAHLRDELRTLGEVTLASLLVAEKPPLPHGRHARRRPLLLLVLLLTLLLLLLLLIRLLLVLLTLLLLPLLKEPASRVVGLRPRRGFIHLGGLFFNFIDIPGVGTSWALRVVRLVAVLLSGLALRLLFFGNPRGLKRLLQRGGRVARAVAVQVECESKL